jgi:hypothetical protein
MFLHDPDSRVRLKAGSILLAYADAGLKLHPQASAQERAVDSQERAAIIDELEMIYAQAGIPRPVEDAAREHREAMGKDPEQALIAEEEAEPAQGDDKVREFGEDDTVEKPLVAQHRSPAVQFRLEAIPGYFPAKYRRVRIEP